eukprot:Nitzschia sp. Nitz4//scaffold202_size38995//16703//17353//NITZ4_007630-RA/size38995-snap-gene-0.85-mRNA-1//1//CDS//3329541378//2097//frame0
MSAKVSKATADAKILGDLKTLSDKMDVLAELLEGQSSLQGEAAMAVVGFLEASGPRMVELVEAAATGALSEEVFAECLSANDRLQKLLADVDVASASATTATAAPAAAAAAAASLPAEMGSLDLFESTETPASAGPKTTGEKEVDLFDTKLPAAAAPAPAAATSQDDDAFDAFFATRQEIY